MQPEGVERRLAAILAADVVGYSRLMAKRTAGKEHKYGHDDLNHSILDIVLDDVERVMF